MTTQPEALRLADELEDSLYSADGTSLSPYGQGIADEAAAELRRLQEINSGLCRKANTLTILSARDEDKITALEAINQELLAVLKESRKIIRASSSRNLVKDWDVRVTAAIARAERTTT